MKKYLAEFLGTFTLSFIVGLSLTGTFPLPTPVLAALIVGVFVYTIGHISGTHLNPAITLGARSIKKISDKDTAYYLVSQFIGAGLALFALSSMGKIPDVEVSNSISIAVAECAGTFFLAFGIASVIFGKTSKELSGVVIGGSLLFGIGIAVFLGSNGVLNPAVALSINSFGFVYFLAPIIGSILGMQAYKYLQA